MSVGKGKIRNENAIVDMLVLICTMPCFHEIVENQNAIIYILDKRAGPVIQKPVTLEVQKVY